MRRRSDSGFTLIELMVTMAIAGTLAAIGIGSVYNWQRASQLKGSAQGVVSDLRSAAERATSEGRTYCMDLTPSRSYRLWRYSCGSTGTAVDGVHSTQASQVTLTATVTPGSPAGACPSGDQCIYFYPRGTATPATVTVRSSARQAVYTIHVEGLTSRVYQ